MWTLSHSRDSRRQEFSKIKHTDINEESSCDVLRREEDVPEEVKLAKKRNHLKD